MNKEIHEHDRSCSKRHSDRGVSSFHMQDPELVFAKLALKKGITFLDLGCGAGDYSIRAATELDGVGSVYVLDRWQPTVDRVQERAVSQKLKNVKPVISDLYDGIDLPNNSIDVCLAATVLHALEISTLPELFAELRRVLRPQGQLAIIECGNDEHNANHHRPPVNKHITPKWLELELEKHGFAKTDYTDMGATYLLQLSLKE